MVEMAASDEVFTGSIAKIYDSVLGPFMFEPFARETASRLSGFSGEVLEVAAGTGILTRELDRYVAPTSRITATDLNPPMLELAAARLRSPRVVWRQANAVALPFEDYRFDVVACQFGVMFYPDEVAGHTEAARVLRPGGRYVFSVWDELAANPVAETVHRALAERFPDDPPQFLARTVHGHADTVTLRGNLVEAGFSEIAIETVTLDAGRLTADELAVGFCQGTPLRHEIEARDENGVARTTAAVAQALRQRFGGGKIESTIRAHLITAVC